MLQNHPEAGRQGRVKNTRELIIVKTPYIVVYNILSDSLLILRILHGARKWALSSPVPILAITEDIA